MARTVKTYAYAPGCAYEVVRDGKRILDIFICIEGVRVAKRGHPGTPQARTWVSLNGWTVEDDAYGNIYIEPAAPH